MRWIPGLMLATGVFAAQPALAQRIFPQCSEPFVTGRVIEKFNWAERHTWYRGVTLAKIDRWEERALESFGPYPIHRRYCRGRAILSDGHAHTVYYRIEDRGGLAGRVWNVEFCINGYDRWKVYDGLCRVLVR